MVYDMYHKLIPYLLRWYLLALQGLNFLLATRSTGTKTYTKTAVFDLKTSLETIDYMYYALQSTNHTRVWGQDHKWRVDAIKNSRKELVDWTVSQLQITEWMRGEMVLFKSNCFVYCFVLFIEVFGTRRISFINNGKSYSIAWSPSFGSSSTVETRRICARSVCWKQAWLSAFLLCV